MNNKFRKKNIFVILLFLIVITCVLSSLNARKTWKQCSGSLYLGEVPDIISIGKGSECGYKNIGPLIVNNEDRHTMGLIVFCSRTTLINLYFCSNGTGIVIYDSI